MIVLMRQGATESEVEEILSLARLHDSGSPAVTRAGVTTVVRFGGGGSAPSGALGALQAHPDVEQVLPDDLTYVLASRAAHPEDTVVRVRDLDIGGRDVIVAAGPCSVEGSDQLRRAAEVLREAGCRLMRGGAFKPRTSPYSFQGLGERGLELLREIADEFGLAVVTEVMAPEQVDLVSAYADMLQVGSRSVQNFPLLDAVGRASRPVLLKRGMMSTIDEFLASAEYVLSRGNRNVVLCERGVRSFDPRTRNLLDIVAIPLLAQLTHLPVIADPSHGTGRADLVPAASLAAVAAGADGLLVEIHHDPAAALSDGDQALVPPVFLDLMRALGPLAVSIGRGLLRT